MAIKSYRDHCTEALSRGEKPKGVASDVASRAHRKLLLLAAATSLQDLRSPPGNRLEQLKGDREGQHSIRVNGQFRLCFVWRDGAAHLVEFTDYH
jgi:proteic killer suppression protein